MGKKFNVGEGNTEKLGAMRTLFIIVILVLGFVLRLHNYATWPREGATFDEYAWTWLGMNLIQRGIPVSWSPHPQYKNRTHYVAPGGARFWLVEPYLEHPPLFGLVAGSYALLRGSPDMYRVRLPVMRELALILGVLGIIMVYLLAAGLYGPVVGVVSAFFYAIIPTVVVGSRIVQNENFFVPLFLTILYLVKRYLDNKNGWTLVAVGVLCGLAILAKIPWIAATIAVCFIFGYRKKWRELGTVIGIAAAFFGFYLLYGIAWDGKLFFSLWKLQLHRYDMVFDSVYALLTQPYLVDRYYTDGWIYAGWFAFAILLFKDLKRNVILVFGLLGYLLVYILAIPNEPSHGWYRYPFYPFLAISLAVYLKNHMGNYLATPLVLLGIMLSLLSHTWGEVLGFSYGAYRAVITWFGLNTLPIWFPGNKVVTFVRRNMAVQFVVLTLLSIWSVLLYNEQ